MTYRILEKPFLFFILTAVIASCGQDAPGAGSLGIQQTSALKSTVSVDPPIDPAAAETGWRWLGVKADPDDDCPTPTPTPGFAPWQVRHLFDLGDGSPIPPGLKPFCLYQRDKAEDLTVLSALVTAGLLDVVEHDYMAVARTGSDLRQAVWPAFREQFLTQAGVVFLGASAAPRVRLAVVDTGATRETGAESHPGSSPHGYTLVNMARELLCVAPNDCKAQLTSRLALAYEGFDPESRELSQRNEQEGGHLGTIGELAEALRHEVHAWNTAASAEHLILNLSMAWDPRFGGLEANVAAMPVAARSVYRALTDASCRGVLAVAAAGNLGGGPETETGPLLPAAWEQRQAPGSSSCLELLGYTPPADDFPPSGNAAYRPLLHAAAGVQSDGTPLSNSRPESASRTAAFGDHGLVAEPGGLAPTAALTGSSVSALVTSAAAAAAWHFRPDWRADEVMSAVYQSGDDLGRSAVFCLDGDSQTPCPDPALIVRRVSVCAALAAACSQGAGECTEEAKALTCTGWPAGPPDLQLEVASVFAGAPRVDLTELEKSPSTDPVCQGETLFYRSSAVPVDPCPHHQYHGMPSEPWIGPQPGSDPCPDCWIDYRNQGYLYLEIDGDFEGILTDATLVVGFQAYNLGLGPMVAGDQAVVTEVPMVAVSAAPVFISFTVDGNRSVSSSVLVVGP